MEQTFVVSSLYDGFRLDVFLSLQTDLTRSYLKKLCDGEKAFVNGKVVKSNKVVKTGDTVLIIIPEPENLQVKPQNIPLDIVYQDSDLAVINKPQGLTVHPSVGHHDQTLVNALLYHFKDLSGINGELRPGIVHRLDKDTSGLMLVAKNDFAHRHLAKQIAEKTCVRKYIALLEGKLTPETGHIQTFIARSPKERKKMAVSFDSSDRVAITDYKVLQYYDDYTLANFMLKTGRTHQIRVHSAHLGHPVVGDPLYGFKKQKLAANGQLLHAYELQLTHPSTGERMTFNASLPPAFRDILEKLCKRFYGIKSIISSVEVELR